MQRQPKIIPRIEFITSAGFLARIVDGVSNTRCYVGLPTTHPLYGVTYDDPHPSLGGEMPVTVFQPWKLNFSGRFEDSYLWWFGFYVPNGPDDSTSIQGCEGLATKLKESK